jgi:hypothetical protein
MAEMVPLIQAAARLGVSVDAIRRRIRRGTITAAKQDDRWYVEVPDIDTAQAAAYDAPSPTQGDAITHELVELLRAELDAKNAQLAEAATERAELRRLLGNSQQTVMLLTEGRSEAPLRPVATTDEELPHRAANDDPGAAQTRSRVRWHWRWPWQRTG